MSEALNFLPWRFNLHLFHRGSVVSDPNCSFTRHCVLGVKYLRGLFVPCMFPLFSLPFCHSSPTFGSGASLIFCLLIDVILAIRLYALYNRDKRGEILWMMTGRISMLMISFEVLNFLIFLNIGKIGRKNFCCVAFLTYILSKPLCECLTAQRHIVPVYDLFPRRSYTPRPD